MFAFNETCTFPRAPECDSIQQLRQQAAGGNEYKRTVVINQEASWCFESDKCLYRLNTLFVDL